MLSANTALFSNYTLKTKFIACDHSRKPVQAMWSSWWQFTGWRKPCPWRSLVFCPSFFSHCLASWIPEKSAQHTWKYDIDVLLPFDLFVCSVRTVWPSYFFTLLVEIERFLLVNMIWLFTLLSNHKIGNKYDVYRRFDGGANYWTLQSTSKNCAQSFTLCWLQSKMVPANYDSNFQMLFIISWFTGWCWALCWPQCSFLCGFQTRPRRLWWYPLLKPLLKNFSRFSLFWKSILNSYSVDCLKKL